MYDPGYSHMCVSKLGVSVVSLLGIQYLLLLIPYLTY